MSDNAKAKYADLFTIALDTMEANDYTKPWVSPHHGQPMNYKHKKAYRGMNDFFLTLLCAVKGYETPYFLTFNQLQDMGLNLNLVMEHGAPVFNDKGMPVFEHSFPVVKMLPNFYKDGKRITAKEYDELTAEEKEECRRFFSMHPFAEFNLSQTDFAQKFPEKWQELIKVPDHDYQQGTVDDVLDEMIMHGQWRCKIEFGGQESSYSPSKDLIRLPKREQFLGDHMFYATAIHEMAHSTHGECKRPETDGFGSESYAMEEFVAELTAACVCSMLGIGKLLDKNHIAYVQNWRQALKNDKDFIPKVIDQVQSATNYILRYYDKVAKSMQQPLLLAA